MDRKQSINDFMLDGIESSVASMSLVKRFTIRPSGVVSKKFISALKTECKSLLCIIFVALINIATKQRLPINKINSRNEN